MIKSVAQQQQNEKLEQFVNSVRKFNDQRMSTFFKEIATKFELTYEKLVRKFTFKAKKVRKLGR